MTSPGGDRRVRPRGVWAGTAVAVVGAVVLGVAVGITSWVVAGAGLVLLLAGTVVGYANGGLYDVHTRSETRTEIEQVIHDETRRGVAPGDEIESAEVHRRAREVDSDVRRRLEEAHRAPRPPMAGLGAAMLLLVAVFLVAAQWGLYPQGVEPQESATRSLGVAVVVACCALRVLVVPGRHRVTAGVTLAAGGVLLVSGLMLGPGSAAVVGAEVGSGVLVVLAGLAIGGRDLGPPMARRRRRA